MLKTLFKKKRNACNIEIQRNYSVVCTHVWGCQMFASCSLHYLAQESVTLKVNQLERHWDSGSTSPIKEKERGGKETVKR